MGGGFIFFKDNCNVFFVCGIVIYFEIIIDK